VALFAWLRRQTISRKLSGVLAAALLALCAMGAIAVNATSEIARLGAELNTESERFAKLQLAVAIDLERAAGEVHSAPSELDLEQLKAKRENSRHCLRMRGWSSTARLPTARPTA
jgi:hypothetical protein